MTVQEASQKVLLIFYKRHTTQGFITNEIMEFEQNDGWTISFVDEVLRIALEEEVSSPIAIKNSLEYLRGKGLISFMVEGLMNESFSAYYFSLTANGIDMIEGVGGTGNMRVTYQNTFNVKLADNVNVESLLKTELKASVLSLF